MVIVEMEGYAGHKEGGSNKTAKHKSAKFSNPLQHI